MLDMNTKKILGYSVFFITLALLPASAEAAPPGSGWTQTLNEEFNGNSLDTSLWNYMEKPRHRGYWDKDSVFVNGNGQLILEARKNGDRYETGAIRTRGNFEQKYGYFEVKVDKFLEEEGHWSAFWVMSPELDECSEGGSSYGTEIDIFEKHATWGNSLQHALHWNCYGADQRSKHTRPNISGLQQGSHTVSLLWTPNKYVFYVDGKETWRTTTAVSDVPSTVWLSDAAGSWAGDIDKANLPDRTVIDYVKVWQKDDWSGGMDSGSDSTSDDTGSNEDTSNEDSSQDFSTGPCHILDSGSSPPSGFGASWNVLEGQGELMLKANCTETKTDITVGTTESNYPTYVYNTGYYLNNGNWQQKSLSCAGDQEGAWCYGLANTQIPRKSEYFIGYVCQRVNNKWKCGCRNDSCNTGYWQLQGVEK